MFRVGRFLLVGGLLCGASVVDAAPRRRPAPLALVPPTLTDIVAGGASGGGGPTAAGDNVWSARNTFGSAADAANAIDFGVTAGCIQWEGSGADAFESNLCVSNPGLDITTTIPALAASQTVMMLEGSQTISANKIMSASFLFTGVGNARFGVGDSNDAYVGYNQAQTPDSIEHSPQANSNCIQIFETTDRAYDFQNTIAGTGAATNPCLAVHDKDQNTTDYQTIHVAGLSGKYTVTLTESSATTVLTIPVADNGSVSGTLHGKVFASDGTNHQARSMMLRYVVVNEGNAETCTIGTVAGAAACGSSCSETTDGNLAAITSGTLTYAWACTAGSNAVTLTLNAVSSLTQTTLSFEGQNFHVGAGEVLP